MKQNLLGWKHSKGNFEGTDYDYVVLYLLARMQKKDNQAGSAGIEVRGEPALVEQLRKMDFGKPVPCDIQTETIALGKGQCQELAVKITPLPASATA
jgi:hypothetical protein